LKNGFRIKRGSCFGNGYCKKGDIQGVRNFGKKIPGNFFLEKGSYRYLTPSFGVGRGVYGGVKKGRGGIYNLLTK
jgi:hypothetical protein